LTDAIEYRKKHNETDSTGYEFYQRSIKTIFQVGIVKDETYKANHKPAAGYLFRFHIPTKFRMVIR
jgi:hypothetical protein